MADVPTYAVMPTFGRPCFEESIKSIITQVDHSFVIQTADFIWTPGSLVSVIEDFERPKNISRWWNHGIRGARVHAALAGASAWNVLVVNDDVIAPPHLVRHLTRALRHGWLEGYPDYEIERETPVIAYPDNFVGDRYALNKTPGAVDLTTRMSGWCFMIKGESGLMADERFEWWYGDDDLDWRARIMGGSLMVPGCKVEHLYPTKSTAESAELTARTHVDRQLFERKWSGVPH